MSIAATPIVSLVTAACVALAFGLVGVEMRAQHAQIDALIRELSASRAELERTRLRTDTSCARSEPTEIGGRGLDPRDIDAIAARVASMNQAQAQAQARTDALVAAEAKAPTPQQLAARDDAQHKVDAMIASGHARREDVLAIRNAIGNDLEGRVELARQVAAAINSHKLVPDDPRVALP
jgi:hypothetical protein